MKYTKNQQANRILRRILATCEEVILSECDPIAILLAGSYARGEGMVIQKNDKIHFISDIDVYLLGKKSLKKQIRVINDKINKVVGEDIDINLQYMDIASQHDDISAIDLKYQTVLLYGYPVHKSIDVNTTRALRTSIRFLMSKSKYLLLLDNQMSKEEVVNVCSRAYAEMATVLCSKAGIYKTTYLERCNTINKIRFSSIPQSLIKRIVRFTKHKLGFVERFEEGKVRIYHQTISDLCIIWSSILKIPIMEVKNGGDIFKKRLAEEFFSPYMEEAFDKFLSVSHPPFRSLWIKLIQIYDLVPFLILLKKRKIKNVYIPGLISPYIWIYSQIIGSLSKLQFKRDTYLVRLWDLNARRRYHF